MGPICIPSRYDIQCTICCGMIRPGDFMFPYTFPVESKPTTTESPEEKDETNIIKINKKKAKPKKKKKPSFGWSHEQCQIFFGNDASKIPKPPTCRHWARLGRCPLFEQQKEDKDEPLLVCAFKHDEDDRFKQQEQQQPTSSSNQTQMRRRKWGGRRAIVRNRHKNSAFRIFLIQTYGVEYLQNSLVLDIAGGKGELSWELLNLVGCRDVVIVEPRREGLKKGIDKMQKLYDKGMFDPKRTGPLFSKWYPAVKDTTNYIKDDDGGRTVIIRKQTKRPKHIQCFFDAKKFLSVLGLDNNTLLDEEEREETILLNINCDDEKKIDSISEHTKKEEERLEKWFQDERKRARKFKWTTKGLTQHEDDNNTDSDIDDVEQSKPLLYDQHEEKNHDDNNDNDDEEVQNENTIRTVKDLKHILSQCKLIIGLHPDQAAGEIVKFGERLGIPWCIVPCW